MVKFSLEKLRLMLIFLLPIVLMSYNMTFTNVLFYIAATVVFLSLKNEKYKWLYFDKKLIIIIFLCCIGLIVSNLFSIYDINNSIKWARRYCYWILPLFIMYGLVFDEVKCQKAFAYGCLMGSMGMIFYAMYQSIILDINRPSSVTTNPNIYSATLCMVFPVILFYLKNNLLKVLTIIMFFFGIVISGSRASFLGFCLILIMYTFHFIKKNKYSINIRSISVILVLLFGFCGIGVFHSMNNNSTIFSRFKNLQNYSIYDSGGDRIYLWQSSIEMIKDYPLYGVGLRNFNKVYTDEKYIDPRADELELQSPHNIILHLLNEIGIIGTLPFIALIGYLFYWCKINSKNISAMALFFSLLAIGVNNMLDYQFLVKQYYQLFWLVLGISFAIIYFRMKVGEDENESVN